MQFDADSPDQDRLDRLADELGQLTEADRAAVVRKATAQDTAGKQADAAARLREYLGGTRTKS